MKKEWETVAITKVGLALHVPPEAGKLIHRNRALHGFILNLGGAKDYIFATGQVLHTTASSLFYLPKHSSYEVVRLDTRACYAINFDAPIADEPFCFDLRHTETVKKQFKQACDEWLIGAPTCHVSAMRALYTAIGVMLHEEEQAYMPNALYALIDPAVSAIDTDFCKGELTVEYLASLCGISSVYFRKIFASRFGMSPKEYIIRRRIDYACTLLRAGDFSVGEVALLCGYAEPCHFSREFTRLVGTSPSKWR